MRQRKKKLEQWNGGTGGEKREHAGEEKTEKRGLTQERELPSERTSSPFNRRSLLQMHLLNDIDGTNLLSIPFSGAFLPLAESCWSGKLGGAVESTFCDGWVGGQEDTLCPGLGLPRGHLDRGNTCRVPGQTWTSTLTHTVKAHVIYTYSACRLGEDTRLTLRRTQQLVCDAVEYLQPARCSVSVIFAHYMHNQENISRMYRA